MVYYTPSRAEDRAQPYTYTHTYMYMQTVQLDQLHIKGLENGSHFYQQPFFLELTSKQLAFIFQTTMVKTRFASCD